MRTARTVSRRAADRALRARREAVEWEDQITTACPRRANSRVVVTDQDVGERKSKPVKYDLPRGVDVIEADRNRTIDFRLVDRSTLTP